MIGILLQACGGAADRNSSDVINGAIGPHTIVITHPVSNAIENLQGGVYRMIGKVIVTDSEGNGIAGVTVNLKLIDSIIARGTFANGGADYISGGIVHDTSIDFSTASVTRNGTPRGILPGDHVLVLGAEEPDKRRYVGNTSPSGNDLYVASPYWYRYPTAVYTPVEYLVGASLLGAFVKGESGTTDKTVTDQDGVATFYVTYPADVTKINTGCGNSNVDTRHLPLGSADVYLVAWVNDQVATISDVFCFSPIKGGEFETSTTSLSLSGGGNVSANITVRDGGDGVAIPFTTFTATITDYVDSQNSGNRTNLLLENTSKTVTYLTDDSGQAVITIFDNGGTAAGTATLEISREGTDPLTMDVQFSP